MRLYRDLNTVCGLASFIGAMAIVLPPVLMNKKVLLPALLALLWIIACAVIYRKLVVRRLNRSMSLLEDCRIRDYVAEYENLLTRARKNDELYVKLNLSAGYIEQGYPRKALDLLRNLPDIPAGKRGIPSKLCRDNNAAVCYRMLGDLDAAEKLLDQFRSDLAVAPEKTPQLAQLTASCQAQTMLLNMARGKFDGACAFFEEKLKTDATERSRVADHYALAWVSIQEGDRSGSARHLEYVLAHGGDTWYVGAARERMRQLQKK